MTDSSDLVERLRKRKEFFTNDGAHWLMSPMPDQDCAEAADTIADQEIWIEQLKAVIQRLEAELRCTQAERGRAQEACEQIAREDARLAGDYFQGIARAALAGKD
jgi:hypothetical protein